MRESTKNKKFVVYIFLSKVLKTKGLESLKSTIRNYFGYRRTLMNLKRRVDVNREEYTDTYI